jgi:thymidylate kinase
MDMTAGADAADPLLAEFGRTQGARNGVPDDGAGADRKRCLQLLQSLLADDLEPEGIGVSPLGVEWTEVFDVHPRRPLDAERLAGYGWLPLDRLLGGRRPGRGRLRRWAVLADGRVLAGIRLVDGPVDQVRSVLDRCRERSEVRLREVLELRELRRRGLPFPTGAAALRAAAEIESGLGGRLLAPWATGRSAIAPAQLPGGRRSLVVAVSGVDGSGKSTLRAALADSLDRAGLPVSTVWVRPGMGLGPLTSLAAWGKRLLRQDAAPGLRAMADPEAARPASRRGAVGWMWALLVTGSFLLGVWRQHLSGRGVVIYDRHLVDALATLDFAYDGVDLRLQRRLVQALLPSADVRLYLDVPAEVSVARKPDDLLGEHAVRRQLAGYARWLDQLPPAVRLDATLPTADLVARAVRVMTAATNARHNRPRKR